MNWNAVIHQLLSDARESLETARKVANMHSGSTDAVQAHLITGSILHSLAVALKAGLKPNSK